MGDKPKAGGSAESRRLDLPKPRGVRGHLKYTWSALTLMGEFRRLVKVYDLRLRESVLRRDKALEALGRAALDLAEKKSVEEVWTGIQPFLDTLNAIGHEHDDIEKRSALMHIALKSTEEEGRQAIRVIEDKRGDLKAEQEPHLNAISEHNARLKESQQQLKDLKRRRQVALDQLAHLREQVELPEADKDEIRHNIHGLDAELIEIDREIAQQEAEEAACNTRLEVEQAAADELGGRLDEVDQEERARRAQLETRLSELRATMQESTRKVQRLDERKRAIYADLGREIVALPEIIKGLAGQIGQAKQAEQTCDQITAARAKIQQQWELLDTAPIQRTTIWLIIVVVALIATAWLW